MNPENIKSKVFIARIMIVVIGLILLGACGYIFTTSQAIKSDIRSNLSKLKLIQDKLNSVNTKYSQENESKYSIITSRESSSFLPWQLTEINNEISAVNKTTTELYSKELSSIQVEFASSLSAWKLGIEADKDFEGRAAVLEELAILNKQVSMIQNLQDLEIRKGSFNQLQTKYKSQLDMYNKKALIDGLKSSQGDIDGLIEYFKKYPALSASLVNLQKYKSEVDQLSSEESLKLTSISDLESKLNNQLRPLLSQAITAKNQNEERIRLATQAQNQAKSDAPIKSGKVVVVNKSKQRMFVYENGNLFKESPVTTGRNNWPTDPGTYSILTKERNRRLQGSGQGATWNVFVKYWMLFNAAEEEGIHDASWRNGNFGGPDFVSNGSRGCVNTPEAFVEWLFGWVSIGTPVVVLD
jgi:lipoprotein-anchoring transpeptidase ErfK/SrfK/galactitol-specific phosphotransferase system IIB component